MPYSTVDGAEVDGCDDDQTAVVKDSDGELMGCHGSEDAAQEQVAALEASEDDRATPDELSEGDRVRWDSSGGNAYGRIEDVVTDGEISAEPEGPTMEGTGDNPAYGVRVYDIDDGEWVETDTLTVHRADALTPIDSFPEDRAMSDATGSYRAVLPGANIRGTRDDDTVTVQFMTEQVARDGMVLDADGIDTSAFEQNPVVLWSHGTDPRRGDEPIAKAHNLRRNGEGMLADVTFADDEFAQRIREKVRNGFVNAVSIGWRTEDIDRTGDAPTVTEADMTEFSFVAVPADTEALVKERTAGSEASQKSELREEVRAMRRELAVHVRGQSLASTLEDAITDMAGDDMSESDIQFEMADAAGIEGSTLDGILGAEIECPPLERLEGFADVLDIDLDTIVAAAENDGCEYDRSGCSCDRAEATATSPQPESDPEGTPSASDDASRDAAQEGDRRSADAEQYVPLSALKKLKAQQGRQWTREDIRTELKKILGMA